MRCNSDKSLNTQFHYCCSVHSVTEGLLAIMQDMRWGFYMLHLSQQSLPIPVSESYVMHSCGVHS